MTDLEYSHWKEAQARGLASNGLLLLVDVSGQRLSLVEAGEVQVTYPVSTSARGIGNQRNSLRTPPGLHRVARRFGDGEPSGRIFRERRVTRGIDHGGSPDEDLILTRILWLEGLEPGRNTGERGIDSYSRYIYIHGTNREDLIGTPASHGCIRMKNADVIELFETTRDRETWCWIIEPAT